MKWPTDWAAAAAAAAPARNRAHERARPGHCHQEIRRRGDNHGGNNINLRMCEMCSFARVLAEMREV